MARRHSRAWHEMHDAALANRAAGVRPEPMPAESAPPLPRCGTAMPLQHHLDFGGERAPADDKHSRKQAHREHGRLTGNYDD